MSKVWIPRTSSENLISYWWLKEIYSQLPYHYRKNLKGVGISFWDQRPLGTWVHSNVWKVVLHCLSCVTSCMSCIDNEETNQIKSNWDVGQLKMPWFRRTSRKNGQRRGIKTIISTSAFYTVHPSLWTRVTTWWFSTFLAPAIKHKIHNIHEVTSSIIKLLVYKPSNFWQINLANWNMFAGKRAWLCDQLNRVWHSYVHTGALFNNRS